jgi:acetylornithine deacetylase/succinyl-diaminopimelate desuccinylase-like protein
MSPMVTEQNPMVPGAVREYLHSRRDELLSRLFELLRIPSVANDQSKPDQCRRAAKWLAAQMKSIGLKARVLPTEGKPAVVAEAKARKGAPTLLVYCHYDVQPAEPLSEWTSAPFEPVVRDGYVYARGASDDKGPLMAYLAAVEAWIRAGGGLPINVKFLVEGEEEIGSPNVETFLLEHGGRLAADAAVVPDVSFFAKDLPSITYGLRGLAYFEVAFVGAASDVHSGEHGGALANPVHALSKLIAAMHDDNGRVTIDGFYDDVLEVTEAERRAWRKLPFDEAAYAASLGVDCLSGGEKGIGVLERIWARPTVDCNGVVGGYTAAGSKTIIPSKASAKVSMRLVSRQDPQRIAAAFKRFVARHTPPGMRSFVAVHAAARPVLVPTDSAIVEAGRRALREAFGRDAALVRCGASVPVTECIQRILDIDPLMMGCYLPDDNHHAPNERYSLDMLWGTSLAAASLITNLSQQA